jgi:hypothetical protein
MKRLFCLFFIAAVFLTTVNLFAQEHKFGLGVMIGAPTGISAKYWVSEDNALDFGLAYSFVESTNALSIHADYLYHENRWFPKFDRMDFYYGYGVRIRSSNDQTSLGARGVAGLAIMLKEAPVDIFIEIAPVFKLIPSTALNLDVALGARYYFN